MKITTIARWILGLNYFVFGLNGFLQFLPMPPLPPGAGSFMGALAATGYFFPFLKGTEVICGLLLLAGVFSPLALIILMPITLQILCFHGFLTPGLQNLVLPIIILALQLVAAWGYKEIYAPLLKVKS